MHESLNRREVLLAGAAAAVGWALSSRAAAAEGPPRKNCTLSIGTYSLKGLTVEEGAALVARIGYDALEIATQPGFGGTPAELAPPRRKALRALLAEKRLPLTALMEQITPAEKDPQHKDDCERLKRVFEMGHDLAGPELPLVQTVLGGGQWEQKKTLFRDRLGDWLRIAQDARMVLAIKPHRGGGMSRPEEAIWLIQQLGDAPALRMVYDYSHYAFRDMPVAETVRTALPYTAHVAVKDAVERNGKIEFAPAGESGTFDYAALLRLLYAGGYRGDVCCEISAMVWKKPGYDPQATAEGCYQRMSAAFAAAGVPRR